MNFKVLSVLLAIVALSLVSANAGFTNYVAPVAPEDVSIVPAPVEPIIAPAPIAIDPISPVPIEGDLIVISNPTNPSSIAPSPVPITPEPTPINPAPVEPTPITPAPVEPNPRPTPVPVTPEIGVISNPVPIVGHSYIYFAAPIRVAPIEGDLIVISNPINPAPVEPPIVISNSTPITPAPVEPIGGNGGSSGGNNGGSGGNNRRSSDTDDDDDGGRRVPILLGNDNPESEADVLGSNERNGWSAITGAVTGVIGKKGALGLGILVVIIGAAGLLVHNRDKLGLVKKSE